MFDSVITKCVSPKSVSWTAPDRMLLDVGEDKPISCELLKGAQNYIHKQIDVKFNTSKELYKKSQSIWSQLKDLQLDRAKQDMSQEFTLEKDTVLYLLNEVKDVVDMEDLKTSESVQEFKDKHQQFVLELTTINKTKKFFTDGKGGLVKFVCYKKDYDVTAMDYTPVVILELNSTKSSYKVYTGILVYSTFTFVPKSAPLVDSDSLFNFIKIFDMDSYLNFSDEDSERLYSLYKSFKPIEISARELTNLVKKAGYKLEVDPITGLLLPIESMNDSQSGMKVAHFYNTFSQETAVDILSLNDFKKTFKYNVLTLNDLLQMYSKEYLQYEGSKINVDMLSDLVFKLIDYTNSDKIQTNTVIENFEEEVK